jgi:hypothetical protein
VPVPSAREVSLPRLVALVVLTAAFAPAAVLGALPLLLLTMVSGSSMLAAVVLALPRRRPVPATVPVPAPAVDTP